jgi:DNA-binding response OmpR family regulator
MYQLTGDPLVSQSLHSYKGLKLDFVSMKVWVNNHRIFLKNKEFSLLKFLFLNKGKALSRQDIYEEVWDMNAVALTNTVDVHIMMLRKKIERPFNKTFIKTIHSFGYIFA